MLLMWPSGLKFKINHFHTLYACKITTANGLQTNCSVLLLLLVVVVVVVVVVVAVDI